MQSYDIIGDIHGCNLTLVKLLTDLARIFHRNADNGVMFYKIGQRVSLADSAKSIAIAIVTGESAKMAVEMFPKTA